MSTKHSCNNIEPGAEFGSVEVYKVECFMESISLLSRALFGIRAITGRPVCIMSPRGQRDGENGEKVNTTYRQRQVPMSDSDSPIPCKATNQALYCFCFQIAPLNSCLWNLDSCVWSHVFYKQALTGLMHYFVFSTRYLLACNATVVKNRESARHSQCKTPHPTWLACSVCVH